MQNYIKNNTNEKDKHSTVPFFIALIMIITIMIMMRIMITCLKQYWGL